MQQELGALDPLRSALDENVLSRAESNVGTTLKTSLTGGDEGLHAQSTGMFSTMKRTFDQGVRGALVSEEGPNGRSIVRRCDCDEPKKLNVPAISHERGILGVPVLAAAWAVRRSILVRGPLDGPLWCISRAK